MTEETPLIRKPAVAGKFYPANPIELSKAVASLFTEAQKIPLTGRPLAVIVPHSGFLYSGKIAARAFKLLEGEQFDNVVVIAPSNTVFFKGCSVYEGAGYETPMGVVEIEKELSEKIASINLSVYLSNMGHATGPTRGEHSLEVQLPFLQVVLGKFKLIAIVMGEQEEDTARALGQALGSALSGTNTLIVAASNLSHFHSQKDAKAMDSLLQSAIQKFDPKALMDAIESGKAEASGGGAIAAALYAAKQLGGKDIRFLGYANSGETTGQVDEVVGYMSAAILTSEMPGSFGPVKSVRKNSPTKEEELELVEKHKEKLKEIVVSAITAKLKDEDYSPAALKDLKFQRGAYVTIVVGGEPKGIAGRVKIRDPLYQAVADMAQAAATQGIESRALTESDLDSIEVKLFILSRIELVNDFSTIKIGIHGLMIKLDLHSSIFFPTELSEKGWDRKQCLERLCLKAGLPKNSYKDKSAQIFKFTAQEF